MKTTLYDELHVGIYATTKLDQQQKAEVYRIIDGLQQWLKTVTILQFPVQLQPKLEVKVNR